MPNYEREAKIALLTGIVFAIAFGLGVDEWLRDTAPTFTKTGTTVVFGLVGLVNIYQVLSAIKKLAAAAKSNAVASSASDRGIEPASPGR